MKRRKDNRERVLKGGESQRNDIVIIRHGQALIVANDASKELQQNLEENGCCLPFY